MREWAERENEMMGGERGWGGREIGKGWGKRGERGWGWGRLGRGSGRRERRPIMHFKTGHSDSMQRVGNLPEYVAAPRPRAERAKPVVCRHSDLDVVLLGSCL